MDFDLTPWERKIVEAEVHELRRRLTFPIGMAPGHHTTDLFPCAPLHLEEINIDCHGNLTTCCHLSGHGDGVASGDIIANLAETTLTMAYAQLVAENRQFRQAKERQLAAGHFADADFFTCWHCANYYKKTDWLRTHAEHAWAPLIWAESDNRDEEPQRMISLQISQKQQVPDQHQALSTPVV
jgi:hypothetical protein